MFGLPLHALTQIMQIINKNDGLIQKVILFGSRARNTHTTSSDVDLAVEYVDLKDEGDLAGEFTQSTIPYKVDLIHLNSLQNEKLLAHINKEGVVLYDKSSMRGTFRAKVLILEKLDDFVTALDRLDQALKKDIAKESLFIDGTIQRFEFCFELCWKLMKAYLNYLGIALSSPRMVFREAAIQKLVEDATPWLKMLEKRNLTTHTYNEETALEVYTATKHIYSKLFHQFKQKIVTLTKQEIIS